MVNDEHPGETDEILFNDLFPLPFRILILIQFGLFLWFSLNVILYNLSSINVLQLLNLSYNSHNYLQLEDFNNTNSNGEFETNLPAEKQENLRLMQGIWRNFKKLTVINVVSWVLFKFLQYYKPSYKIIYYIIPIITFNYNFYILFYKHNFTNQSKNSNLNSNAGQIRIWTTIKRVLIGNINSKTMRTNDILISDSLVSFAKVLNDFGLFIWSYYINETKAYNYKLEFGILCLPILIRIKQCFHEYRITSNKQHLLNLLKYATGIGPLGVNALIKYTLLNSSDLERENGELINKLTKLNNWWLILTLINSTYSFIWDIKMDWNLDLFNNIFQIFTRDKSNRFIILRNQKQFPDFIYIIAISIDFLLRYLWILKIFIINEELKSGKIHFIHVFSTFLFGYDVYSFGYVLIETLEIFRRWVWCFIKLDADYNKLKIANDQNTIPMDTFEK
ncbi:ERD1 [Candida pseudojiufengensis]|uniref:ERD1 n=1 Tax=Candida pseudojiufengensis TaxID=497109 RepID=UPI002224BEBC|nr:ERD1 [Candida pseudojiufengensis]KAI5963256.1 ERD1 [Candida pseudojiufengensis]